MCQHHVTNRWQTFAWVCQGPLSLFFYTFEQIQQKKKRGDSYLLEELRHLTHQTGVALHLAFVSVRQEEVTQQRRVCQRLNDAVHEARVAQVYQTSQA